MCLCLHGVRKDLLYEAPKLKPAGKRGRNQVKGLRIAQEITGRFKPNI